MRLLLPCSAQQSRGYVTEIRGKTDTLDYVRIYGWIAGAINVVLLACLAILCPWWAKPQDLTPAASVKRSATPRWFWPLVIVAMATTFLYSLPRMTHGFWDDEELNVRTTLWGKFNQTRKLARWNLSGSIGWKPFTDTARDLHPYALQYSFASEEGLEPRRQAKGVSVGRVAVSCAGTHFWASWQSRLWHGYLKTSERCDRCRGSADA